MLSVHHFVEVCVEHTALDSSLSAVGIRGCQGLMLDVS
jgi:hypothetical protein